MKLKASERTVGFGNDGGPVVEIALQERPPYSNRAVPLVLRCAFSSAGYALRCDFGDFRVEYTGAPFHSAFRRDAPWKAVAKAADGKTLAEAVGLSLDAGGGITFRETHWADDGTASFSATSSMDVHGVKRRESDAVGRKKEDYFFLWPVGRTPG